MVDRAAPRAADPPSVRRCLFRRQGDIQRCSALAATDRLAPPRSATPPAARQRPRQHAEIAFGGEVSFEPPSHHSTTSSARASKVVGTSRPIALAALWLITSKPKFDLVIIAQWFRSPVGWSLGAA